MYLNILKKDLRRKKTMNIILLLFIMLASMFVSSSVNNIVTVTGTMDYYFEKANVPDYFVATMKDDKDTKLSEKLSEAQSVNNCKIERVLYANPGNFIYKGDKLPDMNGSSVIMPLSDAAINYFDKNDNIVKSIGENEVFITGKTMSKNNFSVGDKLDITFDGQTFSFTVAGSCKDAVLGSDMMGMTKFIISEKMYEKMADARKSTELLVGGLYYVYADDISASEQVVADEDNIAFAGGADMLKMTYVMDMIVAGVLLIVSVCLIIVSFVVLRFTIGFTLSEEFREIGVMKAIGIKSTKIRGLYMTKYFTLALIGSVVGFFASIPFGNLLIKSVSESMVMGNENSIIINIISSVAIVLIILLFCFGCTGKVKKFSPIDAIRNGTTGERFKKKGALRLKNSHTRPSIFMAFNDVLSSPKRFSIIILAYTLCLLLILIISNTASTLRSGNLAYTLVGMESDVYYSCESEATKYFCKDGKEMMKHDMAEIEKILEENGMPCECHSESMQKLKISYKDKSYKSMTLQGINTTADMYRYNEGTPPQNANEIAMTKATAKRIGADIGDTVTISHIFGDKQYIITAFYHSMNNMGEGVRLHEDAEIDFTQISGVFPYQINFNDNPDADTIKERIEKMKDIFEIDTIMTAGEFVDSTINVAEILDAVKLLVSIITIIVIVLVTVLMERSFIAKEQSEIALLKALGFKSGSVIAQHTLRFVIVGIITIILSIILSTPLTKICIDPIFAMMGAEFGIKYEINKPEVFAILPVIVLSVTIISAFFTSLYTRTIKASQASSIE